MTDRAADTRPASLAPLAQIVADISKADRAERSVARAAIIEDALLSRRQARRLQTWARLADAVAKVGGGSLLTATLLLIFGGQAGWPILITAFLALLLFVAGTILWTYCDLRAAQREFDAEWLEAAIKEAE